MKAIIGNRRYDTDAKQTRDIASASWSNPSDFHHYAETLYRTGHGRWFLAGRGGPLSRYGEPCEGGGMGGGAKIIPLGPDQALAWLASNGYDDEAEQWFAEEIQDA